jgi:poly(3-hydroxybutyrate) depolymerase
MRPVFALLLLLVFAMAGGGAAAQDKVHFASLDGKDGTAPTALDGYLFRPSGAGPHPAIVFMHGCGGLISRATGAIMSREMDWERRLADKGFVVLMVDSFTPRDTREMCSPGASRKESTCGGRPMPMVRWPICRHCHSLPATASA